MSAEVQFDAIIVPTHRPVKYLTSCIGLGRITKRPLIVMCSRSVTQEDVIKRATEANIEAYAFNLPSSNPLEIEFATSTDAELIAASPGKSSDLSMKRNIGLAIARLRGWDRVMFLDDDIYHLGQQKVKALATALENHSVSALIPRRGFPDNSVVCHAHRLGGGNQDVFASASIMGVQCNRSDLAFFPNVYNEDWFFFADEAANHRIAMVGESHQRIYNPYGTTDRAAWEEFGDLLAEGLYARLDERKKIWDVDADYWRGFIENRRRFHKRVAKSLAQVGTAERDKAAKAAESVRAAQDQLDQISPELCMRFMRHWRDDLTEWRDYLANLPHLGSIEDALDHLKIAPETRGSSVIEG